MRNAPENEALGFLGLAQRAGAVVSGVPSVREAVRSGSACLVVMAGDAASGQLQKITGLLAHREVPVRWVTTRRVLGRSLGRSEVSVVALMTKTFAEQLSNRLPTGRPQGSTPRDERTRDGRKAEEDFSTDAGC